MQMRVRFPLKHITRYAQRFADAYSEPCQVSEMELYAKIVSDIKPLKTVNTKRSTFCKKIDSEVT